MTLTEQQAFDAMRGALEHILSGALSLPRFAEDEGRAAIALADAMQTQPTQRTGDCLLTGVCASEGHQIQHRLQGRLTDEQERAAFESWIAKDCGDLRKFGSGLNAHYSNDAVNNAWTGWKQRADIKLGNAVHTQAQRAELPAAHLMQPDLEAVIENFIEDYEMRGDDENGRDASYQPTEGDKFLLKDAIFGLLADTDWDNAWGAHIAALAAAHQKSTDTATKRLIGWRTADYLRETNDPKMAKNWEVHYEILPIFEGDVNTKLAVTDTQ